MIYPDLQPGQLGVLNEQGLLSGRMTMLPGMAGKLIKSVGNARASGVKAHSVEQT
jgi:hypothetical protein